MQSRRAPRVIKMCLTPHLSRSSRRQPRHTPPTTRRPASAPEHPRRRLFFSVITSVPRYLHGRKRAGAFRPTTRSRPRLGLVVRCGDLALSQKNMPICAFFHVQPKYQNNAIFVNIEGVRPCLSKPSYGASQWALIVRLMQKERPKTSQKSLF